MTSQAKITTKGFSEYLEMLVEAKRDIDTAVDDALLAAAEILQAGMKTRVLKDEHNLEQHIKIKGPNNAGNVRFIEVGVIHDASFTDADTARYANSQEYGWAGHLMGKSWRPYIRPTMDEDAAKARKEMRKVFKKWLSEP